MEVVAVTLLTLAILIGYPTVLIRRDGLAIPKPEPEPLRLVETDISPETFGDPPGAKAWDALGDF